MDQDTFKRKLTTVFSADAVGYSKLMGDDEVTTVKTITAYQKVMTDLIMQHRGRVIDSPGDNLLAEFGSVVDAVQCAVAIQKELQARNDELPENRRMLFRIGINLGDVIQESDRIYGDGVNIAARLEGLAEPGGICISRNIYEQIKKKVDLGFEYLGEQKVKNISEPVTVYKLLTKTEDIGKVIGEKRTIVIKRRWLAFGGLALIALIVGSIIVWDNVRYPGIIVAEAEKMAFDLPEKPSIAVLPFANLSDDSEDDLISDALTSDIISSLSYQSDLFVIDRHSSFFYKDKPTKVGTVAEELSVQNVLEGSVVVSGDKIRVTVQLVDAINGEHLWTERYERQFTDVFELEDDITFNIIRNIQAEILEGGSVAPRKGETKNLEAWLLYQKGLKYGADQTKEGTYKAKELYEQALEKDPNFVAAQTGVGWKIWHIGLKGYSDAPEETLKEAEALARQAVKNYPNNADVNGLMVGIHMTNREFSEALALAQKTAQIEPNSAEAHAILGWVLLSNMQPEKSIEQFEKAMRLDPYYPAWFLNVMIRSYVLAGRYDEAQLAIKQQLDRSPGNFFNGQAHLNMAVVYSKLGEQEKAKTELAKALEIWPQNTISFVRREVDCTDQTFFADYFQTLKQLGLPE